MGATQHYTSLGLRINNNNNNSRISIPPSVVTSEVVNFWASIKQASALVRGGDTHTPKEKKRKGGESSAAAGMTAESMPMSRLQVVT